MGLSAVCSFRLADIKSAFSGGYKVLNRDTLQWSTRVQERVANPGEVKLFSSGRVKSTIFADFFSRRQYLPSRSSVAPYKVD